MSAKPLIAVDVDDVLVPHGQILMERIAKALGGAEDISVYANADELVKAHGKELSEVDTLVHELLRSEVFSGIQPLKGAMAAVERLKQHYELEVVTSRPGAVHTATEEWLTTHFPDVFRGINFVNANYSWSKVPNASKLNVCEQLKADYLIDDSLRHIAEVAACGVKGVLFGSYPWNQTQKLPEGAVRAQDWQEVLELLLSK